MTGRFRATSSRWDWPKGGASPDSPMAQKSVCKISVSKAKNPSAAKRGKYKEPEKGFFFVSEDGHQVIESLFVALLVRL